MQKRLSPAKVYALKGYSVKVVDGKYYIAKTCFFNDQKPQWSRPYKSLHHATNAIARKLQREFVERSEK